MRLKRNQRGDTIVEVLIAVAVASFVLALAYAISHHSTQATLDAQEHSQALRAVETQLEFLHDKGKTVSSSVCFDATGTEQPGSSGACTVAPYGPGTQPSYKLLICQPGNQFDPNTQTCVAAGGSNYYTVGASWSSAYGNNTLSNVEMFYRPPPG